MIRVTLICLVFAAPSVASDHARDLVQSHVDTIQRCEAAKAEIERQSSQRLAELADWRAYYQSAAKEAVDTFIRVWKDHNKKKLEQLQQQWNTAKSLGRDMKDWVGVPHSKGRMFDLKSAIDQTQKSITDFEAGLAKKAVDLHISFVGAIRDLAVKIDGVDAETAKIRDLVAKGEYQIQYPGLGEVGRNRLDALIDQHEKSKQDILDQIAKGEYKVLVPGIGWHTRNSLNAEIDRISKEIENAKETFEKGDWKVYRPLFYWRSRLDLEAEIKAKADIVERQTKWRKDPLFRIYFPGAHQWLSAIDVQKSLDDVKKGIEDVQQSVAAGTYKVYTRYFGHVDENGILKLLDDLRSQLSNPKLSQKASEQLNAKIADLEKGLSDIKTMSALDIVIRSLDKTWWTKALGAFVSLAKPELEGRELDLKQHEAHLGEFRREMNIVVEMHEMHLQRLKRGLAYIP